MNVVLLIINIVAFGLLVAFGIYKKLYKYNYFRRIVAVFVFMCIMMAFSFVNMGVDEEQNVANRDIIFVPDFTYSMNAIDDRSSKSRLAVMEEDMLAIANKNAGARYGIFPLEIKPAVYMPMTTTYSDLEIAVKTITPPYDYVSVGTVWPKMSTTLEQLGKYIDGLKKYDKSREIMVVIMSDYEIAKDSDETVGKIVDAAASLKSKVGGAVVIGYGRNTPIYMPTVSVDWLTGKETVDTGTAFSGLVGESGEYSQPKTARNESNARQIAEAVGGMYVASENTSNIDESVRMQAKEAYEKNLQSDENKQVHQGLFYLAPAAVLLVWLCAVEIGKNYGALNVNWGGKK